MFRAVPLSIIRSSLTAHLALVYVIQVCRQLSSRTRIGTCSSVQLTVWYAGAYAPAYHTVTQINKQKFSDLLNAFLLYRRAFVLVLLMGFFVIKPTRCTNFTNLFCHENLHVSDSSSVHHQGLFTVHSAMVYVIQVCRQPSSRTRIGTCYSVQLTVWYAGAYAPAYQTVSYTE